MLSTSSCGLPLRSTVTRTWSALLMDLKISIPRCGIIEGRTVDRHHEISWAQPEPRELLPVAAGIDAVAALLAVGEHGLRPHDLGDRARILRDQASHPIGDLGARAGRCVRDRARATAPGRTSPASILSWQQQCLQLTASLQDHTVVIYRIEPRPAHDAVTNFVYFGGRGGLANDAESALRIAGCNRSGEHQAQARLGRIGRIGVRLGVWCGDAEHVGIDDALCIDRLRRPAPAVSKRRSSRPRCGCSRCGLWQQITHDQRRLNSNCHGE